MERLTDIRAALSVYFVLGLENVHGRDAVAIAKEALEGGATLIQLREKQAPLKDVLEAGRAIRGLCRSYGVPFVVNDRVDVALLLEADGVHVGQDDIPCRMARQLLGEGKIVGVSVGNWQEAEQAVADGADYLGVGAIYATATKADAGEAIGTSLLRELRAAYPIPIVGIGGITEHNAAPVISAGADGVAVVSAIARAADPRAAAARLKAAVGR